MSVDPVGGSPGSSQTWNRYSYVMNNPLGFVDPTGKFGRGAGFSDEQWAKFQKAQAEAARKMEKRAMKLEEKAAKHEARGKGGANELRVEANYLRGGAAVLRSDGSDGYMAFGVGVVDIARFRTGKRDPSAADIEDASHSAGGVIEPCSPEVWVNLHHPSWSDPYKAQRNIGHESLHAIGLDDEPRDDGSLAYKRGYPDMVKRFYELKNTYYELIAPEYIMDKSYP